MRVSEFPGISELHDLIPAVRNHQERWDGNGYPDHLVHEGIPVAARIIAIAEAYDAMIREHPYQTIRTPEEALKELWRCTGTQFDPEMVRIFATMLAKQPDRYRVLQAVG